METKRSERSGEIKREEYEMRRGKREKRRKARNRGKEKVRGVGERSQTAADAPKAIRFFSFNTTHSRK